MMRTDSTSLTADSARLAQLKRPGLTLNGIRVASLDIIRAWTGQGITTAFKLDIAPIKGEDMAFAK